jgi:hypothetical protein
MILTISLLVTQALQETGFTGNLQFVNDGIELMKYLHSSKCEDSAVASARPDLLLLICICRVKNGLKHFRK